jgi:hypothetical protein
MKVLKINLRLAGIILLLLAAGTLAMVRAHQEKCSYPHRSFNAEDDSTILINSQQTIYEQPVTRLSN